MAVRIGLAQAENEVLAARVPPPLTDACTVLSASEDLTAFLAKPPAGANLLLISLERFLKEQTLVPLLRKRLAGSNFAVLFVAEGTDPSDLVPSDISSCRRFRYAFSSDEGISSGIKGALAELEAQEAAERIASLTAKIAMIHESVYAAVTSPIRRPTKFLEEVAGILDARHIGVFLQQTATEEYALQFATGPELFKAVAASVFDSEFLTRLIGTPVRVDPSCHPFFSQLTGGRPALVSALRLDGVPGFILYMLRNPLFGPTQFDIFRVASREIFHVVRGTDVRARFDVFEKLAQLPPSTFDRDETIWTALVHLKEYFRADGVSLVEYIDSHNDLKCFQKTYIHGTRKDTELFETDHGYAVESILGNRALLILSTYENAEPPYATGLSFLPTLIPEDRGTPVSVNYVATRRKIEPDASLLYYPIQLPGELSAGLKVANFSRSCAFDLRQLRALAMFSRSFAGLLLHLRLSDELEKRAATMAYQERFKQQADLLFYYREITQGVLHQLANHINTTGSAVADLRLQLEARPAGAEALEDSLDTAASSIKAAKLLIADTHARGASLKPKPQPTDIVAEVIRPAIKYAEERLANTDITLKQALTSREFEVFLDPKLAKEGLINILTNAIWAVKAHRQAGKREIFVGVREDQSAQSVRIEITDSGIGMTKEILEKVARFTPFVTFRDEGTGLGLYFTQRLFEHFKGKLQIVSSQPGKGTTVVVTVPILGE